MPIRINPIMAGLLVALPNVALAIEHGQITLNDPAGATSIALNPGDTVTYAGAGTAIDISIAGNSLSADRAVITAGDPNTTNSPSVGLRVSAGGAATLTDSKVSNVGAGQNSHALSVTGAGSSISASGTTLSTVGDHSYGLEAESGAQVTLQGSSIETAGIGAHGIDASGAGTLVKVDGTTISTKGTSLFSNAVQAYAGARVELKNSKISNNGTGNSIDIFNADSIVTLDNTDISAPNGNGIAITDGTMTMTGGSISSRAHAIYLGKNGSVNVRDASLSTATGVALNINAENAQVTLDNVTINANGSLGTGIWMPSLGNTLTANRLTLESGRLGIESHAGDVTLTDSAITTLDSNGHALYISIENGSGGTIEASNTSIRTQGQGAVGAMARRSGANIVLNDSTIDTSGKSAHGLLSGGNGSSIRTQGSAIQTQGDTAHGLVMNEGAAVSLDSTRIDTAGADSRGIWSYGLNAGASNSLSLVNGSRLDTQNAVGLLVSGGSHQITLDRADITARKDGSADDGVLLYSRGIDVTSGGVTTTLETDQIRFDASASRLTGDVLIESGALDMDLTNGSTLTGAVWQRDNGRVNSLALDGSSAWNVRGDSTLGTLKNAGTVAFSSPSSGAFKTLTVKNYEGGGTLAINTRLGDDNSPTDRLVIDGGAATGNTGLRVINADGVGGQTTLGIRVVETINGGATASDAFHLDAGSTGYRASIGTLALNGYDYSLVRGGNGGVADDWYLTSIYGDAPTQPDPTDPIAPTDPTDPTGPTSPTGPITPTDPVMPPEVDPSGFKNVSPETGAYVGNQRAAMNLFSHGLRDRIAVPDAGNGGRLWTRALGGHDGDLRMAEGKVEVDTDSTLLQIGGDVVRARLGNSGALQAGLMAGYGDARTRSDATLRLPGSGQTAQARARGKVSGYSVGLYATAYANDATRLGAYADAWLQYGRYDNRISSDLGAVRYDANVWSASLETGYALRPFAAGSALADVVVEPKAQLLYSHYKAQDATLQGTRMQSGKRNAVTTRAGVRVYPKAAPDAPQPKIRPFLEANWVHSPGTPSVRMGANTLDTAPSRNALELKLGAQGQIGRNVQVSAQAIGQLGSGGQRGYGGMLNVSYRW